GAALRQPAAEARSFQLELVGEHVEERRVRARLDRPGSAVHFDLDLVRHAHPPVDQMRSVAIRLQLAIRSYLMRTSSSAAKSWRSSLRHNWVTRGLDHASRIYPTCALKMPEIG